MRIVDSHVHLVDESGYLDSLLRTMDECGIEKCCMSGLGRLLGHADNADVKLAFRAHPDRIMGAVFIRPGVDGPDQIDHAHEEGFRMIKVHLPRLPYDDVSCFDLWARANEYRMPVLFHTGVVVCKESPGEGVCSWYMHPMRIERITREFPDLGVIVAHLGVHWNSDAAELARMRPNVYVDLSGEPDGWRLRADKVGMDEWLWWPGAFEKVVFGTDVHYKKMRQILDQDVNRLERLGVPAQARRKIFAGNIVRLLGMECS
jgi:predicted TIM-barrel fold metal-dependent hydrolase